MSKPSVNLAVLGISTLLALTATTGAVTSQSSLPRFERQLYSIEVQDQDGIAYDHPFLGGFNLPRPDLVDIDGDGDLDLFVQEYSNQVMFFEQVGTAEEPRYLWRTDSYKDLEVGEWYHFADVDADADFDLLGEQRFSLIRFWRNNGSFNEPEF